MNGLNDALTIGIVLTLVFGALCFYLYSRVTQVEKRVGLTENILLDLKMATENTLLSMGHEGSQGEVTQIEAVGVPTPLDKEEVEALSEEAFYKSVLQGAVSTDTAAKLSPIEENESTTLEPVPGSAATASDSSTSVHLDVNYESLTLKELKALAKQRSVNVSATAHKKDIIDSLKRAASGRTATPLDTFPGGNESAEEGFPVEVES
jgi:ribosomal protein S16